MVAREGLICPYATEPSCRCCELDVSPGGFRAGVIQGGTISPILAVFYEHDPPTATVSGDLFCPWANRKLGKKKSWLGKGVGISVQPCRVGTLAPFPHCIVTQCPREGIEQASRTGAIDSSRIVRPRPSECRRPAAFASRWLH